MHAYHVVPGSNIASLERIHVESRLLRAHDVRIRVHAVSLNYRDLLVASGEYRGGLVSSGKPVIPCSDAAGEVVEIGPQVTRLQLGDRVAGTFFPSWIDGEPTPEKTAEAPGATTDGVLAEEIVLHEDAVVTIPSHLDFVEASTLPCAGLTAWNALFEEGRLQPGSSVLLLGTGGVSIWALQLAKAAGLRVIITSSSEAKLDKARALGADATVNYSEVPDWQFEVHRFTERKGVDLVVEVGGQGTFARSIASARMGGRIVVVGGVSGFGTTDVQPRQLIGGAKRISGIFVGSRAMFERLNRFAQAGAIRPAIDRTFAFDDAPLAFARLQAGRHFGKVVVNVVA